MRSSFKRTSFFSSSFTWISRLSWAALTAFVATGCGAPLEGEDATLEEPGDIGQLEQSLVSGFTLSDCSAAEAQLIYPAMEVLLSEVSTNFDALLACVSSANLIEYRGHTPRKIVENLAAASVTKITCATLDDALADAPVSISGSSLRIDGSFLRNSSATSVAAVVAHELMHNRGYRHSVNDFGGTYYPLTVPEQVRRCVQTRNATRAPNPWPGPGKAPSFSRIVGMHANDACNCVYLRDGYATCGATDYLSSSTNTYQKFSVAPGHSASNIVGMSQTGSMVCAFYDDGKVSCGTQSGCNPVSDLDATRSAYSYSTTRGQSPATIVGMGGDDGNSHQYAWYSDGRVSSGTSDDLDAHRSLYSYDLPSGYDPSDVVEMVSDGSFNCAFYRDGKVSCGTTDDLDSSRSLYSSKF